MSYYNRGNPYGNNFSARNNSNSFSEDGQGTNKRKRFRFGNKNKTANIEPLFKSPVTPPPVRSPSAGPSRQSGRDNPFRSQVPSYGNQQGNTYADYVNSQRHAGPTWYWENYNKSCQSWKEKHQLAYYRSRCLALEFENQMLFEQINSLIEENCIFAEERGEMPSMRLTDLLQGQREDVSAGKSSQANSKPATTKNQGKNKPKVSSPPLAADDSNDLSSSEIECDIDQAAMEAMEIRLRHLISLKKKQKEEQAADKADKNSEMNGDGAKGDDVKKPTAFEHQQQLDQLYGKDSSLISKLETSQQLKFNRSCDTHKPELWMAVPLNPATVSE